MNVSKRKKKMKEMFINVFMFIDMNFLCSRSSEAFIFLPPSPSVYSALCVFLFYFFSVNRLGQKYRTLNLLLFYQSILDMCKLFGLESCQTHLIFKRQTSKASKLCCVVSSPLSPKILISGTILMQM